MSESFRKYFILENSIVNSEDFKDETTTTGTSIYEVIRLCDSVPLFLERHLRRLFKSAELSNIDLWHDERFIRDKIAELIEANKVFEGNIKIVFNINTEAKGKTFLMYFIKHDFPSEIMYKDGVDTTLYFGERDNPNAKIINHSFREKVNEKIREKNVYEAILVDRNGNITEGSRSNIFMVKGSNVYTAPLGDVLPGITREIIIELLSELGIVIEERSIHYTSLKDLDAMFISGTSPKVLPIKRIDDINYNSSNDIVTKLMIAYNNSIEKYVRLSKINQK